MSGSRYVLLGLAHPRSEWFRHLAQWCNGGAIPAELIKCLSPEEVLHRLDGGRRASALIVDATLPGVDRDLITAATSLGCVVIVIDDPRVIREWRSIGASDVLPQDFDRAMLLNSLVSNATLIDRATDAPIVHPETHRSPVGGQLIAVCGSGGTGVSTLAIALAQGLASDGQRVVLADLKLHAEQAMLHDVTAATGGLQSLVDAHRTQRLSPGQIGEFTLTVPLRGYELIVGLRRARFWSTIRPVAFTAALTTLVNTYDAVVCDVDADVEREATGGSIDVEERTAMSRLALLDADVVMVVAHPSMKGLHALNRLLIELGDLGVDITKILPVFNQSAKAPRVRAGYAAALAELIDWRKGDHPSVSPIHLPSREVDELLRSGDAMPDALVSPLMGAVKAMRTAPVDSAQSARPSGKRLSMFSRVKPGSLGIGTYEEDAEKAS
jgi:MinD-like ATPase involved in chromosome partitioning or flagellar assembly